MLDKVVQRTLSNGLKVVCLPTEGAPVVAAEVWYRTGSIHERAGIRGISHFLEHMMFRGSKALGSEEHARRINDVGGHCNAFTGEDVTAFLNAVPRDHLRMVLDMEADRMAGLILDPQIVETERKVIIEEYHTYMNNPVTKAFLEFRSHFFHDHPYAVAPLGVLEDLQRFTAADCREYFERWYGPDNAVLVIVGDVGDPASVLDMAESSFGGNRPRNGAGVAESVVPGAASEPMHMKRRVDFDVPLLVVGFSAPPASGADVLALEILQMVFAQGESSRLYHELVRASSTAIMAGGMNQFLKHAGMSLLFAAFSPDVSPQRVEKAILTQVNRICEDGITAEEMEKVKNTTLSHRVHEMYSVEQLGQRLGFSEIMEGDYRLWIRRLKALEALTLEDVRDAARRHWDARRMHVLHLSPKRVSPALRVVGLMRRFLPR